MKILAPVGFATLCLFSSQSAVAQKDMYFPPVNGNTWLTLPPDSLGWCVESISELNTFLDEANTKAFIVLKDGKIVLEEYFDEFLEDSVWYWASAAKVLVATMIGIAQEDGLLHTDDPVSDHLGTDWTNCSATGEQERTIFHQLTMSSGFNTSALFWDCTLPECFNCTAPPGTQWHYHNGVYRRLIDVLESASGLTRNQYTTQKIKNQIGMGGFWFDNLYISTARDMARFGLLALNDFQWDGTPVLSDMAYVNAMRNTALPANPAYGYLWWLNGKDSYYAPLDFQSYQGSLVPSAPADMYAGMGANDQRLYVVPSTGMVVVRMGEVAWESAAALSGFDDELWQHINALPCTLTASDSPAQSVSEVGLISPNPGLGSVRIHMPEKYKDIRVIDNRGVTVWQGKAPIANTSVQLPSGLYIVEALTHEGISLKAKAIVL